MVHLKGLLQEISGLEVVLDGSLPLLSLLLFKGKVPALEGEICKRQQKAIKSSDLKERVEQGGLTIQEQKLDKKNEEFKVLENVRRKRGQSLPRRSERALEVFTVGGSEPWDWDP